MCARTHARARARTDIHADVRWYLSLRRLSSEDREQRAREKEERRAARRAARKGVKRKSKGSGKMNLSFDEEKNSKAQNTVLLEKVPTRLANGGGGHLMVCPFEPASDRRLSLMCALIDQSPTPSVEAAGTTWNTGATCCERRASSSGVRPQRSVAATSAPKSSTSRRQTSSHLLARRREKCRVEAVGS